MNHAYSLIVPDYSPLITLAAARSLDLLLKPGMPVLVPDGVHWETVRFPGKLGAEDIVSWLQRTAPTVRIEATQEFADAQILIEAGRKRIKGLGERCALEVANLQASRHPEMRSILLYEDSDVLGMRIINPKRVDTLTTADFLFALEEARLIQSADHILDRAVEAGRDEGIRKQSRGAQAAFLASRGGHGL
jgi:hypothetical protein